MSRRHPKPALSPEQLTAAWQSASLLLSYPDETLLGQLDLIRAACRELPPGIARRLCQFVAHVEATPLELSQIDYVDIFDTSRRCSLFLTYFAHGDTRKRGTALLRFKQAYLRSGFVLDDSELPDHLCVVLEYAATIDHDLGWRLLLDHRAGLELLRISLRDRRSPWMHVLDAVCSTLPTLRGDDHEVMRRLALEGPPEEQVGLSPYGVQPYGVPS
jgi:nitrate reductase delta subunit